MAPEARPRKRRFTQSSVKSESDDSTSFSFGAAISSNSTITESTPAHSNKKPRSEARPQPAPVLPAGPIQPYKNYVHPAHSQARAESTSSDEDEYPNSDDEDMSANFYGEDEEEDQVDLDAVRKAEGTRSLEDDGSASPISAIVELNRQLRAEEIDVNEMFDELAGQHSQHEAEPMSELDRNSAGSDESDEEHESFHDSGVVQGEVDQQEQGVAQPEVDQEEQGVAQDAVDQQGAAQEGNVQANLGHYEHFINEEQQRMNRFMAKQNDMLSKARNAIYTKEGLTRELAALNEKKTQLEEQLSDLNAALRSLHHGFAEASAEYLFTNL